MDNFSTFDTFPANLLVLSRINGSSFSLAWLLAISHSYLDAL